MGRTRKTAGETTGSETERGSTESSVNPTTRGNTGTDTEINSIGESINEIPVIKEVKKERKKRETKGDDLTSNIKMLLETVFSVSSNFIGEHWKIEESEAEAIAVPLTKVLKKLNIADKVANVSDGFALVTAVGVVTIPRIIITVNDMKEKKRESEQNDRPEKRTINSSSERNNIGNESSDVISNNPIYQAENESFM